MTLLYISTDYHCNLLPEIFRNFTPEDIEFARGMELQAKQSREFKELERKEVCGAIRTQRAERLAQRDLKEERFLGLDPLPKDFVLKIRDILEEERSDYALFFHFYQKYNRQHDLAPTFVDHYYRKNKRVYGKRILRTSSFKTLCDKGLLRHTQSYTFCETADEYELTELVAEIFHQTVPQEYNAFSNIELVNPITLEKSRRPSHKLDDAPDAIKRQAEQLSSGTWTNLAAIYNHHQNISKQLGPIRLKSRAERSSEEQSLLDRWQSNQFNLLGIKINGYVQQPAGDVILQQSFGLCSTGRLKLRYGGYLNLSKDYRDIGLDNCSKVQWVSDMKAAQVSILIKYADKYSIPVPILRDYTQNKCRRQELANQIGYGVTAEDIKTTIISACMGVSVPSLKELNFIFKNKSVTNYSVLERFFKKGGQNCYVNVLTILNPILKEIRTVADTLYETHRKSSSGIVTNAVGMKQRFWTQDGRLLEGQTGDTTRRDLVAHILQGEEQWYSTQVTTNNPTTTGYEHDGWIGTENLTQRIDKWVEVESEPRGGDNQGQQQTMEGEGNTKEGPYGGHYTVYNSYTESDTACTIDSEISTSDQPDSLRTKQFSLKRSPKLPRTQYLPIPKEQIIRPPP